MHWLGFPELHEASPPDTQSKQDALGLMETYLAAWSMVWAHCSPTWSQAPALFLKGCFGSLQFCKAYTYFIIYPNAKLGEELCKETCLAGTFLHPAAGAEPGLDCHTAGPAGESPWMDKEGCLMLQGCAHCEVPLPLLGCRQHPGAHPHAVGFSTLKGLDAQLCQPKSLLARAAQKSFCARAAEGFSQPGQAGEYIMSHTLGTAYRAEFKALSTALVDSSPEHRIQIPAYNSWRKLSQGPCTSM